MISLVFDIATTKLGRRVSISTTPYSNPVLVAYPQPHTSPCHPHLLSLPSYPFISFLSSTPFRTSPSLLDSSCSLTSLSRSLSLSPSLSQVSGNLGAYTRTCSAVEVWEEQAEVRGPVEDHGWFEDRWMVASLCDEWLTTLCGLILG
jgi:hypothetical protein